MAASIKSLSSRKTDKWPIAAVIAMRQVVVSARTICPAYSRDEPACALLNKFVSNCGHTDDLPQGININIDLCAGIAGGNGMIQNMARDQ